MRLRLKIITKNRTIPVNYKHLIQGLVYTMLGEEEKFKTLHDEGVDAQFRPFKLFVISDLSGKFIYEPDSKTIRFENEAHFDIGCRDEDIILRIIDFLNRNTHLHLGREVFEHNGYELLNDKIRPKEKLVFTSISPVTVYVQREGKTQYLEPMTEEYRESIIYNLQQKHRLVFHQEPSDFEIVEIIPLRKRIAHFKKTFVVSHDLRLSIKNATDEVIDLLMNTGIGSKNSMGFGMLKCDEN